MAIRCFWPALLSIASVVGLFAPQVQAIPLPLHAYEFNGSLADSGTGNVAIESEGGVLGATTFTTAPQLPPGDGVQGLTLSSPTLSSPGVYTIEMLVKFDSFQSISDERWSKVIDFKNSSEGYGVYVEDPGAAAGNGLTGMLTYARPGMGPPQVVKSAPILNAGEWAHLAVSRTAAGEFTGYINGSQVYQVADDAGYGIFSNPIAPNNSVMRFLQVDQDTITQYNIYDTTGSSVDFLRIYDSALSPADVATLAAAVPEPSTGMLLGAALMSLVIRRRHRQ